MENIFNQIGFFLDTLGILGGIISSFVILIESIFPIIPLIVFVTINFHVFGSFLGFIISWIFCCLGCTISYFIFKYKLSDKFNYLIKDKDIINRYKNKIKNMDLFSLTILTCIPFFPAFIINVIAGLTKMDFKKYIVSILIGKVVLIYYSGYLGTSLIESISNPVVLIKVGIMVGLFYVLFRIIKKVLNI